MRCEVTVNQIHKKKILKKIIDLSEFSPNVNSIVIDKNSC